MEIDRDKIRINSLTANPGTPDGARWSLPQLNEGFSSAGYLYLQLQSCGALRRGECI